MKKSDLIDAVAARGRITNVKAESMVNAIFRAMSDAVLRGERIELRGFGSFTVKHYDSYSGRNPKTGKAIEVTPKRLPVFKPSKEMRSRLRRP